MVFAFSSEFYGVFCKFIAFLCAKKISSIFLFVLEEKLYEFGVGRPQSAAILTGPTIRRGAQITSTGIVICGAVGQTLFTFEIFAKARHFRVGFEVV